METPRPPCSHCGVVWTLFSLETKEKQAFWLTDENPWMEGHAVVWKSVKMGPVVGQILVKEDESKSIS